MAPTTAMYPVVFIVDNIIDKNISQHKMAIKSAAPVRRLKFREIMMGYPQDRESDGFPMRSSQCSPRSGRIERLLCMTQARKAPGT